METAREFFVASWLYVSNGVRFEYIDLTNFFPRFLLIAPAYGAMNKKFISINKLEPDTVVCEKKRIFESHTKTRSHQGIPGWRPPHPYLLEPRINTNQYQSGFEFIRVCLRGSSMRFSDRQNVLGSGDF